MKRKMVNAAAVLIAILLLICGCNLSGITFDSNRLVLADNLDFSYGVGKLAATAAASYYKDNDGSFVIWWEERETQPYNGISEDDPNFRDSKKYFLIRINPEAPEEIQKTQIGEWKLSDTAEREIEMRIPLTAFCNSRGNTVIIYTKIGRSGEDSINDITFEEYDRDFNLIKAVNHPLSDLPGGEEANSYYYAEKDDSDNYYLCGDRNVAVFDADFKFMGKVEDIPENIGESVTGEAGNNTVFPSKGSDGAVYVYYIDEINREVYKINPTSLSSQYIFDLSIEDSSWLYPGDSGYLFYGAGLSLIGINADGSTDDVMKWGTYGVAPGFGNNHYTAAEDFEGNTCFYKKGKDYYNIVIEDKDGDEETLADKELVLYEFIRK
jgi:hypothetical protein